MIQRNIQAAVRRAMADTPVVLLNGARQTGKTTLAQELATAPGSQYFTLDDAATLALAAGDPAGFIRNLTGPVVIDEIQKAPDLFPAIKRAVDQHRQPGRFLLTGSANATDAAFSRNVEFLTELVGKKSVMGIEALLNQEKGQLKLMDLLEEFIPGEPVKPDPVQDRLDRMVEDTTRLIAQSALEARVIAGTAPDEFVLHLGLPPAARLKVSGTVQIRCWPISISEDYSVAVNAAASPVAAFDHITLLAMTSFFAFQVEAVSGDTRACQRFALNLPLIGAPDARKDAVLRSLLQNREAVLKLFLMLLFGDVPADPGDQSTISGVPGDGQTGFNPSTPLFECLMRALDRAPHRIEDIARLVEDLRQAPGGGDLLPAGFDKIWPAIAAVRAKITA